MSVLSPQEIQLVNREAASAGEEAKAQALRRLAHIVGVARPGMVQDVAGLVQQTGHRLQSFSLTRKQDIADAGPAYKTFSNRANHVYLFERGSSSRNASAGEILIVERITCSIPYSVTAATVHELMTKFDVKIHYGDKRDPLRFPFADFMVSNISNPHAGAVTGPAVVDGTRAIIGRERGIILQASEFVVIRPGDSEPRLELVVNADYEGSAPTAPAGLETSIDLHWFIQGERFAN